MPFIEEYNSNEPPYSLVKQRNQLEEIWQNQPSKGSAHVVHSGNAHLFQNKAEFNDAGEPDAASSTSPQVILESNIDQERVEAMGELGIYVPTLECTSEICNGRRPISAEIDFNNLVHGANSEDLKVPIAFDLTTATSNAEPTIIIDRSAPSAKVTLPLGYEFGSGRVDSWRKANSLLWLSAMAANEAAGRPLTSVRQASVIEYLRKLDISQRMILGGFVGMITDAVMSSVGADGGEVIFLASMISIYGGQIISPSDRESQIEAKPEHPVTGADPVAQKLLRMRKLQGRAERLALKHPVIQPIL